MEIMFARVSYISPSDLVHDCFHQQFVPRHPNTYQEDVNPPEDTTENRNTKPQEVFNDHPNPKLL